MKRMSWIVGLLVVWGIALFGVVQQGDPFAARHLYQTTKSEVGREFTADNYVDASRELQRVRPWQSGFLECRRRLREIDNGRLNALRDE
jgi:hypothetical protein